MFVSRTLVDSKGMQWLVSEIAPVAPSPTLEELRQRHEERRAWLAFESQSGEVRALPVVPDEWPRCSDVTLVTWLADATPIDLAALRRADDPRPPAPAEAAAEAPAEEPRPDEAH